MRMETGFTRCRVSLCLIGLITLAGCNRNPPATSPGGPAATPLPALSLAGTWQGRFVEQLPVRGATFTYPAEYEMKLVVGSDNNIESLSWNEMNNWMGRISIAWNQPDRASALGEERENGRPELVFAPLYPVFNVTREGQALSLEYTRKGQGNISLNTPGAFAQTSFALADNRITAAPTNGTARARIHAAIIPRGTVTVPVGDIKDFTGSGFWLSRFGDVKLKRDGQAAVVEVSGDMIDNVNCRGIQLFTSGGGGLSYHLNLLNVKARHQPGANLGMQMDVIVLKPDSKVELEATMGFGREAEIVFFKDGRARARIIDTRVAGTEKPLEFELTRSHQP
jgi:hypothetical protein